MIIQEEDFRLIPVKESTSSFDLELLCVVNKGKSSERKEFKPAGYAMSMDKALRKVAMNRLENKFEEGSISLKIFLKEFKEVIAELEKLC